VKQTEARLARAALDGRAWADAVRASLESEGRPAVGGWPGTLSEARAKVDAILVSTDGVATPTEREGLTRHIYQTARAHWLETRAPHVRESNDEEDEEAAKSRSFNVKERAKER